MASHATPKVSHGFIGDHPALVATLFAIAVTAGFLGLIYQTASEPHHGPAPAHGAPAASAPAAHH